MAATEVEICNSALIKVGADRITTLDDVNERARLCKEQYPKVRDDLLRSHPWNFAIEREELTVDGTAPVYLFAYRFAVPSLCLRILEVWSNEYDWQREGSFIVTDSATVKIRYIKKITDVTKYDVNFCEALASKLAADISYSLAQSSSLKETLMKQAEMAVRQARSFDAQEGTPQRVVANDWLTVRY